MVVLFVLMSIVHRQASVLAPATFIEHDPQIPSLHDRRKVKVGSISFLILMRASSTIGPHLDEMQADALELNTDGNLFRYRVYFFKNKQKRCYFDSIPLDINTVKSP